MADTQPTVPFFKKGKSRPTNNRKRDTSPTESASAGAGPSTATQSKSQVVLPSRKQGPNLLSAGTKRLTSQRDDDLDPDAEDVRDGPDVKWTAAGSHQHAAQEILAGDEAEEILARRNKRTRINGDEDEVLPDDGLYHGQSAYKSHIKKNQEVPKAMRTGPQRSTNSTIRTVTIVDYQPDVCKDYKETGYCGFGDTCKFLHDRGTCTYCCRALLILVLISIRLISDLQGWQLDKLAANAKKQVGDDSSDSDSDSDEDVPFACLICRKPYTDPVVTRCGHYYCSACAIKRYAKTPKCLACGTPTGGLFNRADKVIEKMRKKQDKKDAEDADDVKRQGVQVEGLNEASDEDEQSDEQ